MWLFTTFGFYSIVQKPDDTHLTVRARTAGDLDNLRTRVPELGRTIAGAGSDYPFRAVVERQALADGLARIAAEIDYSNFKHEVEKRQGAFRAMLYGRVWSVLRDLQGRWPC